MESYRIENLEFRYPEGDKQALDGINVTFNKGEFITICGKSGCGKTTLLRQLKPIISPHGKKRGKVYFENKDTEELSQREQSEKIGFVLQNPDNQIVCDKVWHELAFGLESLGYDNTEIRTRVSEMASYFGIGSWFHNKVSELSGGQKQLLNLASVMVMQPSVLILDEPTSQLDPIASRDFLETVKKINLEFGITIILSEHRLEEALPLSDRVIVMDSGKIIVDENPSDVGIKLLDNDMLLAMPTPIRLYTSVKTETKCPVTVKEARDWLEKLEIGNKTIKRTEKPINSDIIVELKDVWFRYEKNSNDVLKGLNLSVNSNEIFAIVGGNGAGKTTALSVIGGLQKPYRGKILIDKKMGILPQNPQSLFVKKSVYLDLCEVLEEFPKNEKEKRIKEISELCELYELLKRHPYDLSGGEQQRVALAKVLLTGPDILMLDEPTKGLDAHFKDKLAGILQSLKKSGTTIIMVSHDVEFCAKYADRCAMFFDGKIMGVDNSHDFFSGKYFYTTAANRIARDIIPQAVLDEDILYAMGITKKKNHEHQLPEYIKNKPIADKEQNSQKKEEKEMKKIKPLNIAMSIIFAVLLVITVIFFNNKFTDSRNLIYQAVTIIEAALCLFFLIPKRKREIEQVQAERKERKLSKRTLFSLLFTLVAVPLTILIGLFYLEDKKYYFISLLIILEILVPFVINFEGKRPQAREIVLISVICAIAVAGRAVFYEIPQFKPVLAIVIIAAVCFGGETGFLVGVVTGFISNFFFGQGPWTPWQMFAFGTVGLVSGILFQKGWLRKTKASLCVFGLISTVVIFGGIVNTGTVLMYQPSPTPEMFLSSYVMGFPFDLIHGAATVFFLWFGAEPMIEKLERVKKKYGLIK